MHDVILQMKNIVKTYPGVIALDHVNFELRRGEVHGLLGENGAGKSTLMKVISGVIQPDSGEIVVDGNLVSINNVNEARKLGISIIHQELNLINKMDAAQNIYLGREPKKILNIIDKKKMYHDTKKTLERIGLQMDVKVPMSKLSIAKKQMIEIGKSLSFDANIIIMDEPTAPLTAPEISELFHIIEDLKRKGISIIYISHRLEEIPVICDRATIMRDGKYIGTEEIANLNKPTIINMMAGRVLKDLFPKIEAKIGETVLEIENLCTELLDNISFQAKRGEILALTGLVGAGRTETVRALFGVDKKTNGIIKINGKSIIINNPRNAIRHGIAFLTEDRKEQGFVPLMSVLENITLPHMKSVAKGIRINHKKEKQLVHKYIQDLKIKTPSENQQIRLLSGGNQQKVVLSKWLNLDAQIIILDEPTRGIDVGAKAEIYTIMGELAKQGKTIIMISSEMEEVIAVSDRAIVLSEGRIAGEINRSEFTQEKLMVLAMGGEDNECEE